MNAYLDPIHLVHTQYIRHLWEHIHRHVLSDIFCCDRWMPHKSHKLLPITDKCQLKLLASSCWVDTLTLTSECRLTFHFRSPNCSLATKIRTFPFMGRMKHCLCRVRKSIRHLITTITTTIITINNTGYNKFAKKKFPT